MGRGALFVRRAGAYLIDYAVIAAYALGLALVTITLAPEAQLSRPVGYCLALATLTLPVIITFSVLENRFSATPGKAALGVRVIGRQGGDKPGFQQALVRNGVKFLPWELAHIGIWVTPGQPFMDPPGALSLILMNTAMGAVLIQAGLIALAGTGVHDWIADLRVRARS